MIRERGFIPVIHPNRRNTKNPIKIARMYRWFDRKTYKKRYRVERSFAWEDVYRKLAVTYDRLRSIKRGSRLLIYSLVNYRVTFGRKEENS